MAILTHDEIIKEIKLGNIEITPFSWDQVGPGSVDLHISKEFRTFKKLHRVLHVDDDVDFNKVTEIVTLKDDEQFFLMPNETVLALTLENVKLSPNLCGWLEGRSKFARIGLLVHITAGFMQPGINNRQVLEMVNVSPFPLAIHPGTRICQFIFQRTEGNATYSGRFVDQKSL